MKRNVTFEEISDGRKYKKDDLVKVSCNDCVGCSECCRVTDDTILLDPYDIYELSKGLKKNFQEMIGSVLDFTVIDGVITPYLMKQKSTSACGFLSEAGRCTIHDFRPGFCRLFPLGRIYDEDGDFSYFIQVHECPYENKAKVKVKNWLGISNLTAYENFIKSWHMITKNLSSFAEENPEAAKSVNMRYLNTFFVPAFDFERDFYSQFEERISKYMG